MVGDRLRLQVFVASPSDTSAERTAMRGVVEELNLGVADSRSIVVELVEWETHSWPGVGLDAQDVINHQIDVPDIVVGIFWKRLGTQTGRAASGTVEEIENALSRPTATQSRCLSTSTSRTFSLGRTNWSRSRVSFSSEASWRAIGLLTSSYEGLDDFKAKVRVHLTQIVRRWPVDRRLVATTPRGTGSLEGKSADGSSPWRSLATEGRLSVRIRSLLGGEAYALVGAVVKAMQGEGLPRST